MFAFLAQGTPDALLNISQMGIAGLMGGLWWWERRYSRQREDQLTAAHEALMQQREHLQALLAAIEANTRALTTFTNVQQDLRSLLEAHIHGASGPATQTAG